MSDRSDNPNHSDSFCDADSLLFLMLKAVKDTDSNSNGDNKPKIRVHKLLPPLFFLFILIG